MELKTLNISQLYAVIDDLYYTRKLTELNIACKYYLSLFNHLDDTQTRMVKFYHAFVNNDIKLYEELIDDSKLEDYIKGWCTHNLKQLYSSVSKDIIEDLNKYIIPKLIHIIYLKEKKFEKYHYKCIYSISENCKDYKINLYNDIEPENNEWWDLTKNLDNVNIVKTERIRSFDNYPIRFVQYEADILRLEKLYEFGGVYFDTDILLLKNVDELISDNQQDFKKLPKFLISKEHGDQNSGLINSFLASTKENGFIKEWLESFKSGLRTDCWGYHIRQSNEMIMKKYPHYMIKYGIKILDHKYFFPYKWEERFAYDGSINIIEKINENNKEKDRITYGIHLFDTINHDLILNNKYINDFEV